MSRRLSDLWVLQFGHDVSVVENPSRRAGREARFGASIWPRRQRRGELGDWELAYAVTGQLQFGHDVSVVEKYGGGGGANSTNASFNLATTSASWRTRVGQCPQGGVSALQFGHDVSVVENGRARRLRSTPVRRFNLATTSASWRTIRTEFLEAGESALQFGHDVSVVENIEGEAEAVATGRASIWPRRQRRGEQPACRVDRRREPPGFNLATTSASWRTVRVTTTRRPPTSFNLATTSASWRTDMPHAPLVVRVELQFGHDVSVVENSTSSPVMFIIRPVLQFGHDVSVVENSVHPAGPGDGAAASIWPRRQRRGERVPAREPLPGPGQASIWPRRQRRGERCVCP